MQGSSAQLRIMGGGFIPDENGTNPDAPIQKKLVAGAIIKDCVECPEMVVVPAGDFKMGSSAQEQALAIAAGVKPEYAGWQSPQHDVHVPSFAAGRYAITKNEFAVFVRASGYLTDAERANGCVVYIGEDGQQNRRDNNVSWRNADFKQEGDHPVVCVSWNDVQAYITWLNAVSRKTFRLLTEAEREYATRGGTNSAFWFGDDIRTSQANFNGARGTYNGGSKGERRQSTVSVGSFDPNLFGLYGVHGNVWDWVEDCFHKSYEGAPANGSAWMTECSANHQRVIRGGSWYNGPASLLSAYRAWESAPKHHVGFRLARDL